MKKLIVANWKMNLGFQASVDLAKQYAEAFAKQKKVDLVACPSELAIAAVAKQLAKTTVACGAQNVFWEQQGAYTGEISARFLAEVGCRYIIIGHSERRQHLSESCHKVNLKLKAILESETEVTPIICIGEDEAVRIEGRHLAFVDGQLKRAMAGVTELKHGSLAVAYEPIWAIGTGKTASLADIEEMHKGIRQRLVKILGSELGAKVSVLYGGSVNSSNSQAILALDNVDGLLVGGASLKIDEFSKIANI